MNWSTFFTSSVGKKIIMALTGIFLMLFLIVHAGINALIFVPLFDSTDNGSMFNAAAHFMGSMIVIRIIEIGLITGIFLHIIQGLVLEFQNRSKRKKGYAIDLGNKGSKWYSRSMGLLGTILLLFLLLHWWHFWIPARLHFNTIQPVTLANGKEVHNMFLLMKETFAVLWVVIAYVLACVSLCWHLIHGFQSSSRTMGVTNDRYIKMLTSFGIWYAIIISALFASMPVAMYMGWVA